MADPLRVLVFPFGPVDVAVRLTVFPSRLVFDVFVAVWPPAPVAVFVVVQPSPVF